MKRLAILSTHPIQYNAPLFRMLAADDAIDLMVFYSKQTEEVRFDQDFGREVVWDIPLTDGYAHQSFGASDKEGKKQLIAAIGQFQPDAVLVYGWNFPGHWSVMRHFKGRIPIWFRGDSTLIDPLPHWRKAIRKAILTLVYRSVDRAFYVGKANKRYFLWAGLNESQLTHAPHAVDNAFFMRDDEARNKEALAKRKELGISENATVFLFVGKMEPKKQPLMMGDAFCKIDSNTKSHLIFIGSGELESALKSRFQDHPRIHFVGFQNQQAMPIWYRVGNLLCLPSKGPGETWGLAVNEAMACGCAAVVSDRVGCGEDLVNEAFLGSVFSAGDVTQMASALAQFNAISKVNQPQIREHIEHYSLERIVRAINAELKSLG